MIARNLINYSIPPLKPIDSIQRAIQWMEEFRVKELPVVEDGNLLGYLSENTIYDTDSKDGKVGSLPLISPKCYVYPWNHYYDILKKTALYNMEMIAVVEDDNFMGVITSKDILNSFSQTAMVNSDGAIITFQTTVRNYSLSEISRIVEMNGASILGMNIRPQDDDKQKFSVGMRINNQNIKQIIIGLNKNGYEVTSSYNTIGNEEQEKERIGFLVKYLEI